MLGRRFARQRKTTQAPVLLWNAQTDGGVSVSIANANPACNVLRATAGAGWTETDRTCSRPTIMNPAVGNEAFIVNGLAGGQRFTSGRHPIGEEQIRVFPMRVDRFTCGLGNVNSGQVGILN